MIVFLIGLEAKSAAALCDEGSRNPCCRHPHQPVGQRPDRLAGTTTLHVATRMRYFTPA